MGLHFLSVLLSMQAGGTWQTATGDSDWIPGLGRSSGERNSNPLQYSCLENPMDRGAWWATVHGAAESGATVHTHAHPEVQKGSYSKAILSKVSKLGKLIQCFN